MLRTALLVLLALPAVALLRSHAKSEKHAIFAMACSYDRPKLAPFILSLRETAGFSGEVHLGVYSDIDSDAAEFLLSNNVVTHFEPCDEQKPKEESSLLQVANGQEGPVKSFFMGSLNQRRWFHYKNWMLSNNIDRVWMLDVRDVIFQDDPFIRHADDFMLFPDDDSLTTFQQVRLVRCMGKSTWDAMEASKMPNWCGGTITGSRSGILQFCDSMIDLNEKMQRKKNAAFCTVNDQPLLNYMAFSYNMTGFGTVGTRAAYNYWHGPALNMNNLCDELDSHRNADGKLVDTDGNVIPIVHKWDKCEETEKFVNQKYIEPLQFAMSTQE